MTTTVRAGVRQNQNLECHPGLQHRWQKPKDLSHQLTSLVNALVGDWIGTTSRTSAQALIWDPDIPNSGLAYFAISPVPVNLKILFKEKFLGHVLLVLL